MNEYIDACRAAGRRTRYVLLAITLACTLAFAAGWNSHQSGWKNSRVRAAVMAARIAKYHDTADSTYPLDSLRKEYHRVETLYDNDSIDGDAYLCTVRTMANSHARWYSDRIGVMAADSAIVAQGLIALLSKPDRLMSPDQLTASAKEFNAYRVKTIVGVQVPFVGVWFDINDLSLIAGGSFTLLLLWLLFCLWREFDNMRIFEARVKGKAESRKWCELLGMYQVMTIPHEKPSKTSWIIHGIVPKLLIACPLVVQVFLFWYDFNTSVFGYRINPEATEAVFVFGIVFMFLVASMASACAIFAIRLDLIWKRVWSEIVKEDATGEESQEASSC